MLTICHRKPDGTESVIAAHDVSYSPNKIVSYRPLAATDLEIELRGGTVFVMNQEGRTVARYKSREIPEQGTS